MSDRLTFGSLACTAPLASAAAAHAADAGVASASLMQRNVKGEINRIPPDNPLPQENITVHLPLTGKAQVKDMALLFPDEQAHGVLKFTQDGQTLRCKVDMMPVYSVLAVNLK